jgi:hypothetical protein
MGVNPCHATFSACSLLTINLVSRVVFSRHRWTLRFRGETNCLPRKFRNWHSVSVGGRASWNRRKTVDKEPCSGFSEETGLHRGGMLGNHWKRETSFYSIML